MAHELTQAWADWSAEDCLTENVKKWNSKNVDIPQLLGSMFADVQKVVSTQVFWDDPKKIQEFLIHCICNLANARYQVNKGDTDYRIVIEVKTAEAESMIKYTESIKPPDWNIPDYIDFVGRQKDSER